MSTVETFPCKVTFHLSHAGQKDALKRGLPTQEEQEKIIQMPVAYVDRVWVSSQGNAYYRSEYLEYIVGWYDGKITTGNKERKFDTYPTDEELANLPPLDQATTKANEEEAKEKSSEVKNAKIEKEKEDAINAYKRVIDEGDTNLYNFPWERLDKHFPEKASHAREVIEMRRKEKAELKLQEQQEEHIKLAGWIEAKGSDRLKKMFELKLKGHDFDVISVATDEWEEQWLSSNPDFRSEMTPVRREVERELPTLAELEDLQRWLNKKEFDPRIVSVKLVWNIPKDEEVENFASLDLVLKPPFGDKEVTVYKEYL